MVFGCGERRLQALGEAGEQPDPRDAQITRLKDEATRLKKHLAQSATTISGLTTFQAQALARLAVQHDEITRLRQQSEGVAKARRLPIRTSGAGPCS